MEDVTVWSSSGSGVLTLSEFARPSENGWCSFLLTLEGYGLTASVEVYDHISLSIVPEPSLGDRTGTFGLTRLVARTAEEYTGWEGEKRWESMEGQLVISAVSERTGYATFTVEITEGWRAAIILRLDAEQRKRWATRWTALLAPGLRPLCRLIIVRRMTLSVWRRGEPWLGRLKPIALRAYP